MEEMEDLEDLEDIDYMEEDVQNYSPTFKFRGTPCTVLYTLYCTVHPVLAWEPSFAFSINSNRSTFLQI